jgi:hypothetical protein
MPDNSTFVDVMDIDFDSSNGSPSSLSSLSPSGMYKTPHVLISVAVEENQPELDVKKTARWLEGIPFLAKWAKVESVFPSYSTLLALSIPVPIWDMLPDHPACSFIGYVTGPDLVVKPPASIKQDISPEDRVERGIKMERIWEEEEPTTPGSVTKQQVNKASARPSSALQGEHKEDAGVIKDEREENPPRIAQPSGFSQAPERSVALVNIKQEAREVDPQLCIDEIKDIDPKYENYVLEGLTYELLSSVSSVALKECCRGELTEYSIAGPAMASGSRYPSEVVHARK